LIERNSLGLEEVMEKVVVISGVTVNIWAIVVQSAQELHVQRQKYLPIIANGCLGRVINVLMLKLYSALL
jgi:hypothetical protein